MADEPDVKIEASWKKVLQDEFKEDYFKLTDGICKKRISARDCVSAAEEYFSRI
jgi:uracil DNA glycosylase